jgi:F-type H+-transporting ATPase subunit epsilon
MEENFVVEIISPDRTVFKSNTAEVIIPSFEGEMGILKNHVSLITFLRPGIITVIKENEKVEFFTEDGTVEFIKNNLLILSSSITKISNLSKDRIESIIKISQERLNEQSISDKEKYLLSYKIETLKLINQ